MPPATSSNEPPTASRSHGEGIKTFASNGIVPQGQGPRWPWARRLRVREPFRYVSVTTRPAMCDVKWVYRPLALGVLSATTRTTASSLAGSLGEWLAIVVLIAAFAMASLTGPLQRSWPAGVDLAIAAGCLCGSARRRMRSSLRRCLRSFAAVRPGPG